MFWIILIKNLRESYEYRYITVQEYNLQSLAMLRKFSKLGFFHVSLKLILPQAKQRFDAKFLMYSYCIYINSNFTLEE